MNFVAAVLYAVSSSVLLATTLGLIAGRLTPTIASTSLAAGALVAAFSFWRDRFRVTERRTLNLWEWGVIVLFSLFALRTFLWLVFIDGDEIKVLSPNNLGDLSLHLTYIHQLANGAPFWPENPIVAGSKLTYPLGVDLFNSLLVLIGVDSLRALIWVGMVACVLVCIAIWRWGGAFTLAGFLCNGGLAGFVFLRTGELHDFQSELAWKSLPLALLVTQRGLLFAIPAGLLLLLSWRTRYFSNDPKSGWTLPLWGELLLYASMPVFHLHTFLFLSIVLLAWFVAKPLRRTLRKIITELIRSDVIPKSARAHLIFGKEAVNPKGPTSRALVTFVGLALIPASILVYLLTDGFNGPSVLGIALGWMQSQEDFLAMCLEQFGTESRWFTIPFFWLLNFGIFPFFVVALVFRIVRNPAKQWERAVVFPALGVFVLCCIVRFAPWEWDNTKLMVWSYLAVLPFIWSEIFQRWPIWLRAVCCFGLFWSGFISLLGGIDNSHRGFPIAARSEIDQLAPSLRQIPIGERFIAHPNYNHPLLLLGHPLVLGYTGHVWSHGYEWQTKLARVESILKGEDGWRERALESGAHYLFWGSQEREAYPDSSQPWREQTKLVTRGEWGEIYDLSADSAAK